MQQALLLLSHHQIILPDLTLIRFSVTDDRDNLVGQRVIPLSMIRSGYRFVLLRDKHSQPLLLSSLFVFIKIENFVPENMESECVYLRCIRKIRVLAVYANCNFLLERKEILY